MASFKGRLSASAYITLVSLAVVVATLVVLDVYCSSELENRRQNLKHAQSQNDHIRNSRQLARIHLSTADEFGLFSNSSQSVTDVIEVVRAASVMRGVQLKTLFNQNKDATMSTLGRSSLSVTLSGDYANLKWVLSDVMQRFPGLFVQKIVMRKMTSPTDVQAQVDLLLVSPPVESPAPLQ